MKSDFGQWEAHTCLRDGYVRVEFENGESITVKNDGVTGADFVEWYLSEMEQFYSSHLIAADLKLKQRLGKAYTAIKNVPARYRSELALVSLNCCFGREDEIPDREKDGTFHPEFTLCQERYNCPFNGFNPALKEKKIVCCNPIYECGLSNTQAKVADLIVNTSLSYEDMASAMGCSVSNIDNIRKRIFAQLSVSTRSELTQMLRGKRLH